MDEKSRFVYCWLSSLVGCSIGILKLLILRRKIMPVSCYRVRMLNSFFFIRSKFQLLFTEAWVKFALTALMDKKNCGAQRGQHGHFAAEDEWWQLNDDQRQADRYFLPVSAALSELFEYSASTLTSIQILILDKHYYKLCIIETTCNVKCVSVTRRSTAFLTDLELNRCVNYLLRSQNLIFCTSWRTYIFRHDRIVILLPISFSNFVKYVFGFFLLNPVKS